MAIDKNYREKLSIEKKYRKTVDFRSVIRYNFYMPERNSVGSGEVWGFADPKNPKYPTLFYMISSQRSTDK